jgi:putative ABC transport system permease protein
MTEVALRGAVELGLMYGLVAVGLFLSYRILNLADLTVDGSFTLGAAASIMLTVAGMPWLGLLLAVLSGAAAGFVTAFLQTKLKIQSILAGILTMTALYSINLRVMDGKASVNSISMDSVFTPFKNLFGDYGKLVLILLVLVVALVLLVLFLSTQVGLSVRATGDNEAMVRSSSINVNFTKTLGLVIANGLVGLSGGLLAQYQQSADAGMGTGVVVIGLASLIIGEVLIGNGISRLLKRRSMVTGVIAAVIGAVIYRIIIALVLAYNTLPALEFLHITTSDMKLISSLVVVVALSSPLLRESYRLHKQKKQLKSLGERKDA